MATRQKRVSQIKRETETTNDARTQFIDEQADDDELDRAEALLKQKKQMKESPSKLKKQSHNMKQSSQSDSQEEEDSEDEDSNDSEMDDFIVKDDQADEEDIYEDKESNHKKKKKHRAPVIKPLDEEDIDLIRQNVGIEVKKKSRLKRTAALENSPSEPKDTIKLEYTQIDTTENRKQVQKQQLKKDNDYENFSQVKRQKSEVDQDQEYNPKQDRIDPDRLRQAQDIFGDSKDQINKDQLKNDNKQQASMNVKEYFNADEIDDPFSTEADVKIAQTDIPERLQTKLEGRLLLESPESEKELREEASWIVDRLAFNFSNYGKLLLEKDSKEKIYKVLKMFRVQLFDIPMICKYRKYEYSPELDEDAVWLVFNYDQEFGKFQRAKAQVQDFLLKMLKYDTKIKSYLDELSYSKSISELNNFNALIRFLRYYFDDQLQEQDVPALRRKQPQRRDEIQIARANKIHEFAKLCFLDSLQFQENLRLKTLSHQPPEPRASPSTVSADYKNEYLTDQLEVLQSVCRYAAIELAAQPYIRNVMKQSLRHDAEITTELTELGNKELDIFHQSYRVKLVKNLPLEQLRNSDLILDILQCEKANLITSAISLREHKIDQLKNFFEETYMLDHLNKNAWNKMRTEVIKILIDEILLKEITKEIKEEIQLEAENYVISQCKKQYSELLRTGPFVNDQSQDSNQNDMIDSGKQKRQDFFIKGRERLCVMGALMHQIDANNYIVTVAVVDKFGDLIAHKDFMRLLPPRQKKKPQQSGPQQDVQMQGDQRLPETEEEKEHKKDKEKLVEIIRQHSVDLIVVAANSLEARRLKEELISLATIAKTERSNADDNDRRQGHSKEAFVIWGKTEVAKLFALSHNSQKLHKNVQQILKQTISLARFEQDPLTEVLNLWSPILAENQALALTLDPMQKLVNQSRLYEGLEEENIRAVNDVGVELNLVIDHEHMHCVIQFLSGLGPRMAKRLLVKAKQLNKKLNTRGEMLKQHLTTFKIYFSLVAFVLIRISEEAFLSTNHVQKFDILDQTRIHHEHYKLAMKIATDACHSSEHMEQKDIDKTEQNRLCKQVIANPQALNSLDTKAYFQQLDMTNQGNMRIVIEHILKEFRCPFEDPRQTRSKQNKISKEKLFYLLIDETERTFKEGLIVTATVTKVIESKVICKLENGLIAIVSKNKILEQNSNSKLDSELKPGYIVTGRIDKINPNEDEQKFEVELNCKKGDCQSHENYKDRLAKGLGIEAHQILKEDLKNLNFAVDLQPKNQGRFIPRRIAHEKFKNISSKRAVTELTESDVGDFVFRPSTRSEDSITLTWKFFNKHFVHIDIQEFEKQPGAAIGSRLMISTESFENLREIVERYIIPCNRLVRDVTNSPKWSSAEKFDDLEETLKNEKNFDRTKIPYRFAILPQYQQHVVLAYLPKDKVIKEFIKVRPKGFYFHDQNLVPFVSLVNWFKEQWQTKDYQRFLRRQKSPRPAIKTIAQIKETPSEQNEEQNWQGAGGGSVHSYNGNQSYGVKTEQQKSYGRGQRSARKDSPGNEWGNGFKQEVRQDFNQDVVMNDAYDQQANNNQDQRQRRGTGCHKCGQDGHFARDCQNSRMDDRGGQRNNGNNACHKCGQVGHYSRECTNGTQQQRSRDCYKCNQPGHLARECPDQNGQDEGRGYKRQRRDDGGSFKRANDGENGGNSQGWDNDQANYGGASRNDGWNN